MSTEVTTTADCKCEVYKYSISYLLYPLVRSSVCMCVYANLVAKMTKPQAFSAMIHNFANLKNV